MNAMVGGFALHEGRILRAQGVCLGRPGQCPLEKISFTAWPGELTTLIGAPGSGKGELLALLAAQAWPDSGEVWLGRHSLRALAPERRSRAVHLIAKPRWPARSLTVAEAIQPRRASFWGRFIRQPDWSDPLPETAHALAHMGLDGYADIPLSVLNTYEQVLVRLARALLMGGDVMLLDIDALELDAVQCSRLQGVLKAIAREGRTVVQAGQASECLLAHADQVLALESGRLRRQALAAPQRTGDLQMAHAPEIVGS